MLVELEGGKYFERFPLRVDGHGALFALLRRYGDIVYDIRKFLDAKVLPEWGEQLSMCSVSLARSSNFGPRKVYKLVIQPDFNQDQMDVPFQKSLSFDLHLKTNPRAVRSFEHCWYNLNTSYRYLPLGTSFLVLVSSL